MLGMLEGRFLLTFLSVVEEGSFSRAAEKLGYVQSTVTSQIQTLEQACRQKLFHRFPRGVQLTEAGEKLAVYARQFVQLGHLLEESLSSLELPRGTVRVRALESFCVTRLTGFLRPFFAEYPDVVLRLETGFQADIAEQVASRAVDFGIVAKNPEREDLVFEPLVDEEMALVASQEIAEIVLSKGWERLADIQLIGFGNRCVFHTDGQKILADSGWPAQLRSAEFPSTELIRQTVACGLGVAYVPAAAMERELLAGSVVRIPLPAPVRMTHGLLRHRDHLLNTPSKVFREKLLAFFLSNKVGEQQHDNTQTTTSV